MKTKAKKLAFTPQVLEWMKKHISQMTFYKDASGTYRIQHTGDESFLVVDEDTGEEHDVFFKDLDIEAENFMRLVPFCLADKACLGSIAESVQDWIDCISTEDSEAVMYAKWYLNNMLTPAIFQRPFKQVMKDIKLFCTYQGTRWRVTGGSRLGDVWLSKNPDRDTGYDERVNVSDITEWSNALDYDKSTIK
jgi:hypothetical protein